MNDNVSKLLETYLSLADDGDLTRVIVVCGYSDGSMNIDNAGDIDLGPLVSKIAEIIIPALKVKK